MGCGYACVDCGRCSGTSKPVLSSFCFFCKTENAQGSAHCSSCGKALPGKPGANQSGAVLDVSCDTQSAP